MDEPFLVPGGLQRCLHHPCDKVEERLVAEGDEAGLVGVGGVGVVLVVDAGRELRVAQVALGGDDQRRVQTRLCRQVRVHPFREVTAVADVAKRRVGGQRVRLRAALDPEPLVVGREVVLSRGPASAGLYYLLRAVRHRLEQVLRHEAAHEVVRQDVTEQRRRCDDASAPHGDLGSTDVAKRR